MVTQVPGSLIVCHSESGKLRNVNSSGYMEFQVVGRLSLVQQSSVTFISNSTPRILYSASSSTSLIPRSRQSTNLYGYYGSALQAALTKNHIAVARLLLDNRAKHPQMACAQPYNNPEKRPPGEFASNIQSCRKIFANITVKS